MGGRDVVVGHDGAMSPRRQTRDMRPRTGHQSLADQYLVGAISERHLDFLDLRRWSAAFAVGRRRRRGFRQMRAKPRYDGLDDRVMRALARFDRQIGLAIDRAAFFQNPPQGLLGI